ncbi:MAG: F0F1 ATP synthase subunit epsilon [Chloroflexi bacterium]|nr:F0F1 ATP synthase subunit epsilon [Chloroflexota bacterium]
MATMRLEIVTAERLVYAEDVELLVAPGIEGELGILPHHAPLLTVLQPGELRVRKDGQDQFMAISGGFLEVLGNKATVLADACEHATEIDMERAQRAVERVQEQLKQHLPTVQLEQALASLRRAQTRIKVAGRRRERPGAPPSH